MDIILATLYAWIGLYELPKGVAGYRTSRLLRRRTYALMEEYTRMRHAHAQRASSLAPSAHGSIPLASTTTSGESSKHFNDIHGEAKGLIEQVMAQESLLLPDMLLYKHLFSKLFTIIGLVGVAYYLTHQWEVLPLALLGVFGLMSDWEDLRRQQWLEAQRVVETPLPPLDAPTFALPPQEG